MEQLFKLLAFVIVIGGAFAWLLLNSSKFFLSRIVVFEHETGLLYQNGKFKRQLNAGSHLIFPLIFQVVKFDLRQTQLTVSGQEVLSLDNVSLKTSVACLCAVEDALLARTKVTNYQETLYAQIQLTLRETIGSRPLEKLLEEKPAINQELRDRIQPLAKQYGLSVIEIGIKDLSFPKELKSIFADVIRAQKDGLALLERARGESAALRNLANAAKMMEDHPVLMNLRLLQSLMNNPQSTLVVGLDGQFTPLKR